MPECATVAASIDGTTKETYEKIRVPAKWERLLSRLELLKKARRSRKLPRLRIIFTWMKSNRAELADLPAFAQHWGAAELDVRYVSPTVGVDVSGELLSGEDPRQLNAELASAAKDAVRRGLRLSSFPEFEPPAERSRALAARIRRRLWHIRAGLDRWEHRRHAAAQRLHGCAYPDRYYVIRPNGAVAPCIYWEGAPIGLYPSDGLASIASGAPLARIREGLASGEPVAIPARRAARGERRSTSCAARCPPPTRCGSPHIPPGRPAGPLAGPRGKMDAGVAGC